jgi:hypothetical protein
MSDERDTKKAIYDQDCQFYRYQDGLMWGRFKIAATVEGAVLYGLYQVQGLLLLEKRVFAIFGAVLVLLICLVSLKDQNDSLGHLARIKIFEREHPFKPHKPFLSGAGTVLMWLAIIMLNMLNVGVLWKAFSGLN